MIYLSFMKVFFFYIAILTLKFQVNMILKLDILNKETLSNFAIYVLIFKILYSIPHQKY